jgi:hypothetical protein
LLWSGSVSGLTELSGLEPSAFEHLVNAIALKVLGAGATGFCPGPDAGRDGWFEGESSYPSARQRWTGIWYIQSKFHAPHLSTNAQKWLLAQVRDELNAFSDPNSKREWPDNWIIATNVDPSGVAGRGTFDQARKLVEKSRPSLAKRFHIWGGQKLCNYLGDFPAIAQRFGHFLTPGHVLSALFERLSDEKSTVQEIVHYAVVRGIESQRQTKLEQAGSSEDRRPGIDALFVDLPFAEDRCGTGGQAVASLACAATNNHRTDPNDPIGDKWKVWRSRPTRAAVWFVRAGPGRGKSSVGQFFCQVQRAALILQPNGVVVHPDVRSLACRIQQKAEALGCWPTAPRVPLWVELKSYAVWFSDQGSLKPRGVASFMCALLHRDAETQVDVKTLRRTLGERSWVVVFDGLDEVPSDVKDAVAAEVVKFVRDVSTFADVLSVCTSRPQGYSGQFDALDGAVVDLIDLPPPLALECATKVAVIDRSPDDAARARSLLERAIESPAACELMTTPLQSHIMAVLVRNGQRPPERKWDLYHKFYEVIREREANRDLPDPALRDLFQRDPGLIDTVHQRLGFALHTKAERASGADASLSRLEFRTLVESVVRESRSAAEIEPVVDALMLATTERLVLISTPDQGDRVRFDIRAIQEFFAAEFLYVDTQAEVLHKRLDLIVGDAHWREVVQFVLGALIALKRATEWTVAIETLRALDVGGDSGGERALAHRLSRGALHAALLFDTGCVENSRRTREQLGAILAPIAGATDAFLVGVLQRVTGPDSRTWIREWGEAQVRRLRASESVGALRIVAHLCPPALADSENLLTLLDSIDTNEVGDFLLESRQEARHVHPNQTITISPWKTEALTRLLSRQNCVAAAPSVVEELLWEAAFRKPILPLQSNLDTNRPVMQEELNTEPLGGALTRLFNSPLVLNAGGIRLVQSRLVPNAMASLKIGASGLLGWLRAVLEAASLGGIERVKLALLGMGDRWPALDALPPAVQRAIPVPLNRMLFSPIHMSNTVGMMTEDAFASGMANGSVSGIPLCSPSEWQIHSIHVSTMRKSAAFLELAQQVPRVAWAMWCFYGASLGGEEGHGRESALQTALVDLLERNPFLAYEVDGGDWVAGVAKLGDQQSRALGAMRAANLQWPLTLTRQGASYSPGGVRLALPQDTRFLPLIAASHLSNAATKLRGGLAMVEGASAESGVSELGLPLLDLREASRSSENTADERAAAVFLSGLHPDGGWGEISRARADLLEFARIGLPVAAGTALVAEVAGRWSDSSARVLVSELIDASREPPPTRGSDGGREALDTVLRAWRERSTAPLTNADAISRWLGISNE